MGLYLAHHPTTIAIVAGNFATLSMLTKNSFMDEIKQYVQTARAKGLAEKQVLYGHVFRNAMLIIIAASPLPLSACSSPVCY